MKTLDGEAHGFSDVKHMDGFSDVKHMDPFLLLYKSGIFIVPTHMGPPIVLHLLSLLFYQIGNSLM